LAVLVGLVVLVVVAEVNSSSNNWITA